MMDLLLDVGVGVDVLALRKCRFSTLGGRRWMLQVEKLYRAKKKEEKQKREADYI